MFSIFLIILFSVLCAVQLYVLSKKRPDNFPPGPPRLPIWGSYWFILLPNIKHIHETLQYLANKYKTSILGFYMGGTPVVITLGHELCKEMLTRDEFIGRNDNFLTQQRSLGVTRGISFTEGGRWKIQRRFSLRHLRDYGFGRRFQTMEDNVEHQLTNLVGFLSSKPKASDHNVYRENGEVLFPHIFAGPFANPIIQSIASTQFTNEKIVEIMKAGLRFLKSGDALGSALLLSPWLRYLAPQYIGYTDFREGNQVFLDFCQEIINYHKETFIEEDHRDFIDDFISEQRLRNENDFDGFTDEQLLTTLIDIMVPTCTATIIVISFYFTYLINNPEIQRKVQNEIDEVVGRSRFPNLNDRKRLPYTDASLREAYRKFAAFPLGISRKCIKDTYLGGYFIPEGTAVIANLVSANHDEKVWEEPEKFNPERFLNADGSLQKADEVLSFGAGRRLCAGETFAKQNIFLFVAGLLQNFNFQSIDGKPISLDLKDLETGVGIVKNNHWVRIVPRQ